MEKQFSIPHLLYCVHNSNSSFPSAEIVHYEKENIFLHIGLSGVFVCLLLFILHTIFKHFVLVSVQTSVLLYLPALGFLTGHMMGVSFWMYDSLITWLIIHWMSSSQAGSISIPGEFWGEETREKPLRRGHVATWKIQHAGHSLVR